MCPKRGGFLGLVTPAPGGRGEIIFPTILHLPQALAKVICLREERAGGEEGRGGIPKCSGGNPPPPPGSGWGVGMKEERNGWLGRISKPPRLGWAGLGWA